MQRQTIYDPQRPNTKTSNSYALYTKEDINTYIQSPTANQKSLRNASNYMYCASPHYYRLIQYYGNLLLWRYVISPVGFDPLTVQKDSFKKAFVKAAKQTEKMNLKHEMSRALIITLREGVFFGVCREAKNSFFLQKINPDICEITAISDGTWVYSVDMSQIRQENLDLYPEEFTQMYNEYKRSGQKYQEVPDKISFCLKADETVISYSIPPFASVLGMLYDLETYKSLQQTASEIENYKLISGELPVDKHGNPLFDWQLAQKYYNHINNNLPGYIGLALAPFPLKEFKFDQSGTTATLDAVSTATDNLWSEIGSPSILHGKASNAAGAIKLAIRADESLAFNLMQQCERVVNRYLKTMGGVQKFKINFLPLTVYNLETMTEMYKGSASLGIGRSHYMSAIGIDQTDMSGLEYIEDDILEFNKLLHPLKSSYNTSDSGVDEDEGGRPLTDDEDLGESGDSNRNTDSNENR